MAFTPISETIKQKTWHGPAKGIYLSLRIEKVLSELLPQLLPSTAGEIRMLSCREGKLSLLTPSSAASQEIYLTSAALIKRLNESLGGRAVEEIRFKVEAIRN